MNTLKQSMKNINILKQKYDKYKYTETKKKTSTFDKRMTNTNTLKQKCNKDNYVKTKV